ncbi:hypothetical protein [Sphingorhabdus sp. YGSMI21]|uniref:hypothetical protein n=1 Tax=Sphingorhabdus sp. YGSMI21 TaxID=2077182 RepID=UPI001F0C502A|nr:hypothetical protein [Sphingorhabdus sp. YGSMI21]
MAYQKENRVFRWLFKIFQDCVGAGAFQIVGSINHYYPIFRDRSLILEQGLKGPDLVNLDIASQFMLFERIQTIVPCLLLFLVTLRAAPEQAKIGMGACGEKMAGLIILIIRENGLRITRVEEKMRSLLGKGGLAQSLVTRKNPRVVEHVLGQGLMEYLPGPLMTEI